MAVMAFTSPHQGISAHTCDRTRSRTVLDLLLAEASPADGLVPTPRTPLADGGLELSSLALTRAIVNIEEALGVEFSDAAIVDSDLRTVADVLALVENGTQSPQDEDDPSHRDD